MAEPTQIETKIAEVIGLACRAGRNREGVELVEDGG